MKKLISMILAVTMVMALFAGCGKGGEDSTQPAGEGGPASALELMENVWAAYAEDQKFPVIGGSLAAPVDNGPGGWDMTDENITYSLLIPADRLGDVTEAASMLHMMNSNTFTAAAFKLADGVKAEAFADAMKDAVMNNQWICGFPEQLFIASVTGDYVVVAFGAADLIGAFQANLTAAYDTAAELANEALA